MCQWLTVCQRELFLLRNALAAQVQVDETLDEAEITAMAAMGDPFSDLESIESDVDDHHDLGKSRHKAAPLVPTPPPLTPPT